ncbi:hypothetical protein D3C87_498820 [compost metagenome]
MKHVLALLLVFSTVQSLIAQQYKPFGLDSGRWYANYSTKGGKFGGGHSSSFYANDSVKFYCDGDTIINAMAFKKLMYVGNTRSQTVPLTPISGYYGAIRNDVPNKKVYFLSKNYDSSYTGTGGLLYDFDLTIGDSILVSSDLNDKEPVSSIDSVQYCGEYHKRYNTSSGYFVIEGVGSKHGMFPVKWATNLGWLICYQDYGIGTCTDCNIQLSLDSYSKSQLTIFPNPTTGSVQIESDLDIRSIEVYDIKGTLIEQFSEHNGSIELKNKGIYFLKINTDSETFVRKLIRE